MAVTLLLSLACVFALAYSQCTTTGGPSSGSDCVFPFTYAGSTFYSCTTAGGFPSWCYTEVDSQGVGIQGKYGDCGTNAVCTSGAASSSSGSDSSSSSGSDSSDTSGSDSSGSSGSDSSGNSDSDSSDT